MDKFEIEKLIEHQYNTLYENMETLFSIICEIGGAIKTIRDLNYIGSGAVVTCKRNVTL